MLEDKNNAIFSITSDGVNNKIKIAAPPGASVTTNATKTHIQNIEQESSGGEISHNAADLTQIGGNQTAKNKGKITNRVEGGTLYQENLTQSADTKGEILNEVKKTKNPVNSYDNSGRD
ncbi:MAG: hypothetical protein A2748_03320 [Candidatus Wildermuthbacteria bacterium RIFCSPHIGHO2_01_FULL_45_20]|uniref:Uncharacterized protein n=1 Tax=Candidatus Wildermuthbacteria bacterium RIFCSPHIGHO2_02_FULL_45_25 TaxID=1802450 RepID=A0A1G2R170_9BACT|nr:MAG: hypothetical protein A2748_03320 [Candidatus Wildermuthbacteria bacterium RIFCSPHIGHO2_01_FULL_45_20]OHA66625.1 MAG: hypothetical protein A3C04_00515 [Candidatus Wildermuthbacteria bacterium RIFCSPHIGHO2_02_FULL_45_25]